MSTATITADLTPNDLRLAMAQAFYLQCLDDGREGEGLRHLNAELDRQRRRHAERIPGPAPGPLDLRPAPATV